MHQSLYKPFIKPALIFMAFRIISPITYFISQLKYAAYLTMAASLLLSAQVAMAIESSSPLARYWYNYDEIIDRSVPQASSQCEGLFLPDLPANESAETDANDLDPNLSKASAEEQTITADKVLYQPNGTASFEGNVILQNGEQNIRSDSLIYNTDTSTLNIEGNVRINNEGVLIASESAVYNSESEQSTLNNAHFLMFENGLNGQAESIQLSKTQTKVIKNTLSSCPPGKESWALKSRTLNLDQEKGWGYATHASLHLGKVPVFYTPYFTFPLNDKRKSGFLYPTIGSDSVNGLDVTVPYYINIAPNYDATLKPRFLGKRGNQMGAEFRYLNSLGSGEISGDYLGQDELSANFSERKQAQWQHSKQFSPNWNFQSDYAYISDSDYFDDLNSLSNINILGYLERKANLSYLNSQAYFGILVKDFQVLDTIADVDQPYRLAPQVSAGYQFKLGQKSRLSLDTQATRFERDLDPISIGAQAVSDGELTNGERFVFLPKIASELSSSAYFIKPSVGLHTRQYQLEDYQAVDQDKSLDFVIPSYSLDTGLVFERSMSLFNTAYTQSLEPRLKFLKTNFRDQSEAPDFDASLLTFNSNQVFRDRRYSGHDLVGDTEQVSIGLGSRLFDETQSQKAHFSIAQIAYFSDREIQLNADEDTTAKLSAMVGEATIQLTPTWKLQHAIQWDSEDNRLEQFSSAVQFKGELRKLANLEFRYRPANANALQSNAAQKETRASFFWPISSRWSALSYWNFDLNQHSTIELASGLEYENCCIIVKALNQKWLRNVTSEDSFESANKQSIEIQLKGLGKLNDEVSEYLRANIPGFE